MGHILIASCKCGFEQKCGLGAVESNFKTYCAAPGIDLSKGKLVTENWMNREQLKDKILFYTESELYNGEIVTDEDSPLWYNFLEFGNVKLKITENKCPECNNYTMEFESGIILG